jgi:hypothetical protein
VREHNNAIILTSLAQAGAAGANTIYVRSVNRLAVGQEITVEGGGGAEKRRSPASAPPAPSRQGATGVDVSPALANAHPLNAPTDVTDPTAT